MTQSNRCNAVMSLDTLKSTNLSSAQNNSYGRSSNDGRKQCAHSIAENVVHLQVLLRSPIQPSLKSVRHMMGSYYTVFYTNDLHYDLFTIVNEVANATIT